MHIDHVTLTGIIAGVLTATSMLPQLIKIIRTKKVEDNLITIYYKIRYEQP